MPADAICDSMMARLSAANKDSPPPSVPPLKPAKSNRLTKMFRGTRSASSSNPTPASASSTNLTAGVNPQTPVLKPGFEKDAENVLENSPSGSVTLTVAPTGGSEGAPVRPGTSPVRQASILPVPVKTVQKVEISRSRGETTVFGFENQLSFSPANGPAQRREDDHNGVVPKQDDKKGTEFPSCNFGELRNRAQQGTVENEAPPAFNFDWLVNREQQAKIQNQNEAAPSFGFGNFDVPRNREQQAKINNGPAASFGFGPAETREQQAKIKNDSAPSSNLGQPVITFNMPKNREKQNKAMNDSTPFSKAEQLAPNFDQSAFSFGPPKNRDQQEKTKNEPTAVSKNPALNPIPKPPSTSTPIKSENHKEQDSNRARKISTPSRPDTPRPIHVPNRPSESRFPLELGPVSIYIQEKVVEAVETHWAKMQLEVLEQKIRDDLEIDEKARGGRKDIKDSVVGGGNDKPSQPEGPDSVNGITHKLKHTSIAANVNARPCRSHPSIVTIGPYKFTNPTAVKYLQILAMAFYTRFLVLPAFNGPKELFLTIWRIAIVLGLHVAVLNYMGWKDAEHGIASDIFVEPVVYAVAMLAYLVRERGQGVLRFQGEGLYGL